MQRRKNFPAVLSDEDVDEAEIWEKYKYVVKGNREKERFKYSIIGCIFGVTAILLGNTVGMTAAGAAGAAAIWMLTQEKRKYKHARKRVLREVEKQFPEWLMNLSLQLQTDNVHVSLKKTIPDAPFTTGRRNRTAAECTSAVYPLYERVPDSGCAFCNEDLVFHGRIWN